jgi:hypothetical protein
LERADEQEEERFINGESRIGVLEQEVSELKEIAQNQQKLIELLIQSDELDIKSWIKTQHERWMPLGYIDSQMLDLLE